MKQTTHFNINVPELGDRPDITQVSDAISALEDTTSGMPEYMEASIQGALITLSSNTRTTKRTKYYNGLTIMFKSPAQINPNSITRAKVDDLGEQTISIPFLVSAGESLLITYSGSSFTATRFVVAKDSSVASTSSETVATSLAVKTAYDKAVEALNKANSVDTSLSGGKADKTIQIVAGNGLTGGGDLSANRTIDFVTGNDSLTVGADSVIVNTSDSVSTISSTRPASLTAVKTAYDKGVEALSKGDSLALSKLDKGAYTGTAQDLKNLIDTKQNSNDPTLNTTSKNVVGAINELNGGKVNKAGDTMTGALVIEANSYPAILLKAKNNTDVKTAYVELPPSGDINFISLGSGGSHSIVASLPKDKKGVIYHTGNKPIVKDLEYLGVLGNEVTNFDNLKSTTGYYDVAGVQKSSFGSYQTVYNYGQLHITCATSFVLQEYHSHGQGWVLTRMMYNNNWTPWTKIYTDSQRPHAGAYLLATNVHDFTFDFGAYDYFIVGTCWNGAIATQPTGNSIYNDVVVGELGNSGLDSGVRLTGFNWRAFGNPEGLTRRFSNFQGTSSISGAVVWGVRIG